MGASGMPPTGQQLYPSVSSSSSSPPNSSSSPTQFSSLASHTGGQPRGGYTRDDVGGLRSSASMQDLSSAYRNGSPTDALAKTTSLASGFPKVLASQQAPMSDGGTPSLSTIKSNLLRRPSGFPLHNNVSCYFRNKAVLGLALIGTLLFLWLLWAKYGRSQGQLEYAVVIDCGSTGTRIHVYGWTRGGTSGKESLPVMLKPASAKRVEAVKSDGSPTLDKRKKQGGDSSRLYNRMETEPGLDKLLHNESGVAAALEPLVKWAIKQIPRGSQGKAKLFFLATAGLRRLPSVDSEWLLDRAWVSLMTTPFMCRREWVRVISGQEEAYYGWIALNYNLRRLGYPLKQPTLGSLDLGGSSLEVTFEPEAEIPKPFNAVNVSVGPVEHHLYAQSHPGFGLNDAFEKSVALLVESKADFGKEGSKGSRQISHPCLNAGYKQPFVCSSHCLLPPAAYKAHEPHKGRRSILAAKAVGPKVDLVGKPNWASCQKLVQRVINASSLSWASQGIDCGQSPCALGKFQPEPQGQFFALSGFFVVFKFFGLTSINSLNDLLNKGQDFCSLKWEEAQQSVIAQPSIDRYCFRAPYMVALLRQGLHLSDEQVVIGSGDFAWTLGAALNEAGALLPVKVKGGRTSTFTGLRQSSLAVDVHTFTFLVVIIFLAVILLSGIGRWITSHPWRRPYLPLFVPPTLSGGPLKWFPAVFRPQVRSTTNSGAAATQPAGDGRLKQPHSPAPTDSNSFQLQMFESGDKHAGGDGPVLECDAHAHPSVVGQPSLGGRTLATQMMQQKGGAKLQSRRSQSREDLNAYLSPDILISKSKHPREPSPARTFTPLRHDFPI